MPLLSRLRAFLRPRPARLSLLPAAAVLVAASLLASACDNVEVQPASLATANNTFQEDGSYEQFLAKLYGGLNVTGQEGPAGQGDIGDIDEGFSQYLRLYWVMQELPADAAVIAWNDAGIELLNAHQWSDANQFSRGMYDRIFFQVAQANEFLRQSAPSTLDTYGISAERRARIPQFRAEARFLRALSYWHGLDLFARIPLVEEDFPLGNVPPEQASPQQIFDFIEAELVAITGEGEATDEVLPDPAAAAYGRANKAAAWMLLAKLYQNAPVYLGTPASPGPDRSADVITYTTRVINQGGYTLDPDYHHLFLADNHTADGIIFAIPHDGLRTQHFGGTTFLGNAPLPGSAGDRFGLSGWSGVRVTSNTVDLYSADDDRPRFPNMRPEDDQFFSAGRQKAITNIGDFGGGGGFVAPKYQNVTSTGQRGSNSLHSDVDFPVFRLGDAYLMYAEAVLRGGGGDVSTALALVNDLRERAGLGRDLEQASDLTLAFILDERGRELLWEGHRRTDLRRFGQFTGEAYVWPCKGRRRSEGCPSGLATDVRFELYPLPASELQANPNLRQNPGYGGGA